METNGLLLRLKERKPFASSAERNVIEYVQGNPRAVLSMTIRELADETFTSPSTIVRLCRKLGCDGYKQFQREIVGVGHPARAWRHGARRDQCKRQCRGDHP